MEVIFEDKILLEKATIYLNAYQSLKCYIIHEIAQTIGGSAFFITSYIFENSRKL